MEATPARTKALRERWEAAGQGQVFRFWDGLDAAARGRLGAQLARIDLEALMAGFTAALERPPPAPRSLQPVKAEAPERMPEAEARRLVEAGETLLAEGRVAVVTVAGGQGTRLGFEGPKGAFPLGPVTDRSLFGLFAQQLAGLGRRHGRPVPWLVMTSPATDAATRRFFEAQGHLGLSPAAIRFFEQGTLPALDLSGRVLLAAPDRVAEAPDGHGGVFAALLRSGALAELEARGIRRIFYHHVDNPLARLADPAYLGLHAARGAEMSCKAVAKHDPLEQMGFLCSREGRTEILEYSEIPPEVASAREPGGALRFPTGSIGIHVFERAFVRRVAEGPALPLHLARKPMAAVDERGAPRPGGVEAHKLERFVFDGLARARVVAVMETRREDEYSPVKNARGEASPVTARKDLVARYRRWIVEAGLEPPGEGVAIEMDHARFDGPEDLRRSGIRRLAEAAPHVRIDQGAER